MRVTQLGDFTLAEEEYVKIGSRVIECGWIKAIHPRSYNGVNDFAVTYGSGYIELFEAPCEAHEDVKALYEFRLANALKNEPEGA